MRRYAGALNGWLPTVVFGTLFVGTLVVIILEASLVWRLGVWSLTAIALVLVMISTLGDIAGVWRSDANKE